MYLEADDAATPGYDAADHDGGENIHKVGELVEEQTVPDGCCDDP